MVMVMSLDPGRIMAEQRIALARTRDVSSRQFNDTCRHLASLLQADHAGEAA